MDGVRKNASSVWRLLYQAEESSRMAGKIQNEGARMLMMSVPGGHRL